MKRVFADRAGRETTASADAPSPTSPPPAKLLKVEPKSSTASSTPVPKRTAATTTATPSSNEGFFYLPHQHRALTVEYKQLQHQYRQLEQEQQERRIHIQQALEAIVELKARLFSSNCNPVPSGMPSYGISQPRTTKPFELEEMATSAPTTELTRALHEQLWSLVHDDSETPLDPNHPLQDFGTLLQQKLQRSDTAFSSQSDPHQILYEKSQAELQILQTQLKEMEEGRNHYYERERKLRRNIYRLQTGMWDLKQVIEFMDEKDDNGDDIQEDNSLQGQSKTRMTNDNINGTSTSKEGTETLVGSQPTHLPTTGNVDNEQVDASLLEEQRHEYQLIQEQLQAREATIVELTQKISTLEKLINDLSIRQLSEEEEQKLQQLHVLNIRYSLSQDKIHDLERKIDHIKREWATSLGNEKTLKKSISELQDQLSQRQTEQKVHENTVAQKEAQWKHKLTQALEQVRQAESTKQSLTEALQTNKLLAERIEMLKADNTSLQEEIQKANEPREEESAEVIAEKAGVTFSELTEKQFDRLYRDNRKMKKDLATLTKSKNDAKSRIAKLEKEYDSMLDSNARLLQQSTEKDEVNAKSLSTVIHLKDLLETSNEEKARLREQMKASSELAEAAREATLAKDAVSGEWVKEREELEQKCMGLEEELEATKERLHAVTEAASSADQNGEYSALDDQVQKTMNRCNELVDEVESKNAAIWELQDQLSAAQAEYEKAQKTITRLKESGYAGDANNDSELREYNLLLKKRLTCNICNERDKNCLLLQCKHMHCRECVDTRIANRDRKCPTCGMKFAVSDVTQVY